jgi:hypothetical protein
LLTIHLPLPFQSLIAESVILAFIFANIFYILFVSDKYYDGNYEIKESYYVFLFFSFLFFSAEYGLRVWSCVEEYRDDDEAPTIMKIRIKWMIKPLSLVDFFNIILCLSEFLKDNLFLGAGFGFKDITWLRILRST